MTPAPRDPEAFIRASTQVLPVPLVPGIRLHQASEAVPLWQATEAELARTGLPPPFWAFPWAGGQALARHVLDHPALVSGQVVLDLATGSGLVAIAAAMAGAARVRASDIDPFACTAARLNARLNGVAIEPECRDLIGTDIAVDVLLVGDLFYERDLALRLMRWLRQVADAGTRVLVGDPGRTYLPRDTLVECSRHEVPVSTDLEDCAIKTTRVWTLPPGVPCSHQNSAPKETG